MRHGSCVSICLYSLLSFFSVLWLSACGSSDASPTKTSGLKKRVLVSNTIGNAFVDPFGILRAGTGSVDIMDATKDRFVSTANSLSDLRPALFIQAAGAAAMVTAGGITAVIDSTGNGVSLIDNTSEQVTREVNFSDRVEDIAISPDGKTAYAAIHNTSQVEIINTSDGTSTFVSVPAPRKLVLSPGGSKLLVFADDPQTLPAPNTNAFFVLDTATRTAAPISLSGQDQPIFGVFNASETRAFILNCGAECAGSSASVMLVDLAGIPATLFSLPVAAATVALLNGNNLYVAGTPPGSATGTLQTINISSMSVSTPISITNGHHEKISLANDRLYVGSGICTPVPDNSTGRVHGCLTIVNISTGVPLVPEAPALRAAFDVTGIRPIAGRNVVYVCEGGELDIFDTTTDAITNDQIDVVGKAVDVVQIDP